MSHGAYVVRRISSASAAALGVHTCRPNVGRSSAAACVACRSRCASDRGEAGIRWVLLDDESRSASPDVPRRVLSTTSPVSSPGLRPARLRRPAGTRHILPNHPERGASALGAVAGYGSWASRAVTASAVPCLAATSEKDLRVLELADILRSLRRRWRIGVAIALLTGVVVAGVLATRKDVKPAPKFRAESHILVPTRDDKGAFPEGTPPELFFGQAQLATSGVVRNAALAAVPAQNRGGITFGYETNDTGDLITLSATAGNAELARAVANGWADAYIQRARRRRRQGIGTQPGRSASLAAGPEGPAPCDRDSN